jgi:hypothetical protein
MCLICEDIKKGKITLQEARRNLMEFRIFDVIDWSHYLVVIDLITELQGKEDNKKLENK